ncbi:hypothetical protein ACFOY2_42545 [Nonomuraea purpurea]|uniref:FAD-dependent oxidoreductase n=1 Tax=Nonomuraea purpurea TaxID=1849276 RepID=A0ABV8GJ42_9ACTN
MSLTPRALGMSRPISRRDFFDGVAVGALGSVAAAGGSEPPQDAVPAPRPFEVRGGTAQALSVPHALRDGRFWRHAGPPVPTGEKYDLVVVGGGRSGRGAAREWLRRDPRARVLVLDNHDEIADRPRGPFRADAVMCDAETFGADTFVSLTADWIGRLPIAPDARRDLRALHGDPPDWFPWLSPEGKQERLAELTYSRFLLEVCAAHPDVERFCRTMSSAEWAYDTRAFGAIDAWATGYPGFDGLGLDRAKPSRLNSPTVRAAGGDPEPAADVPVRMSSPVVSVREGSVGYFDGHRVRTVEAGAVILACWSAVVPYLLPGLPEHRRRALSRAVRMPLLQADVRLRDPRAWRRLGARRVRWTGAYWCACAFDPPDTVRLLAAPCRSELGPDAGAAAGRQELFRTSYERLEHTVRDQLARLLGPVGFDPAGDIEAIAVHRWGHGRAPEYCRPWHAFYPDGPFPADAARGTFGRVAIAGSDAAPVGRSGAADAAAVRAVEELWR